MFLPASSGHPGNVLTFADRLIQLWYPTLHKLTSSLLYQFAKPRETPLADNYVLSTSERQDVEMFTLLSRLREKSSELDNIAAASECLDHMAAGIDTTGDGLCFLMWELSQPRSLKFQQKLQRELAQNPDASMDQLPFLDAIVSEGLRCFPPIPMSLPRYVPQEGKIIDGYNLPARTVVSCQAYSVHRMNTGVFPDADRFDPDRWMASEGDVDRRRLLFAFSNGGRGCVGKQ
jgi:cytochrome P450